MRYIAFVNFYCKNIQAGIQTAHATVELFLKYGKESELLNSWATDYKTMILLNGGEHEALDNLYKNLSGQTSYPFTMFQEPGLNFANTAVVVILPERMYDDTARSVGKALLKGDPFSQNWPAIEIDLKVRDRKYTPWEREFLRFKETCGKAI